PARCWRAAGPWIMENTGAVYIAACRSLWPATGRPGPPPRNIQLWPTWPHGPAVANYPLVTYVTDGIANAMAQAKAAAGDRNVLVHGAYTAQRALEAGVLDEVQIH